jgi:hypothetical protein
VKLSKSLEGQFEKALSNSCYKVSAIDEPILIFPMALRTNLVRSLAQCKI